jgi:hypothetical protein
MASRGGRDVVRDGWPTLAELPGGRGERSERMRGARADSSQKSRLLSWKPDSQPEGVLPADE